MVSRKGNGFVPLVGLHDAVKIIDNDLAEAVGALDGEHGVVSKNCIYVVEQAGSTKLVAAVLEAIWSVWFGTADHAYVCVYHFLFWHC